MLTRYIRPRRRHVSPAQVARTNRRPPVLLSTKTNSGASVDTSKPARRGQVKTGQCRCQDWVTSTSSPRQRASTLRS
jgi:hypothetical protein